MKFNTMLVFILLVISIHAEELKDKKLLFSCHDIKENIFLYGQTEKSIQKIMIESNSDAIENTAIWFPTNQIKGKFYNESFSRGVQTIIKFKIDNFKYVFEDSIIARGINEIPSQNIVKKVLVISPDQKKSHITCRQSNDGVKGGTELFFEKGDLFDEYENNAVDDNTKSISVLKSKSPLYREPSESSKSKMYLIAGDKVKLLDTKTDTSGQKWYYISYQGKKEIKAWIKAEAVK